MVGGGQCMAVEDLDSRSVQSFTEDETWSQSLSSVDASLLTENIGIISCLRDTL